MTKVASGWVWWTGLGLCRPLLMPSCPPPLPIPFSLPLSVCPLQFRQPLRPTLAVSLSESHAIFLARYLLLSMANGIPHTPSPLPPSLFPSTPVHTWLYELYSGLTVECQPSHLHTPDVSTLSLCDVEVHFCLLWREFSPLTCHPPTRQCWSSPLTSSSPPSHPLPHTPHLSQNH